MTKRGCEGDGGRRRTATGGDGGSCGTEGWVVEGSVASFELRRGLGSAPPLLTTRRRPVKCGGAISAPAGALTAAPPPWLARRRGRAQKKTDGCRRRRLKPSTKHLKEVAPPTSSHCVASVAGSNRSGRLSSSRLPLAVRPSTRKSLSYVALPEITTRWRGLLNIGNQNGMERQ